MASVTETLCRRCGQSFDVAGLVANNEGLCSACRQLPPLETPASRPGPLPQGAAMVARPIPVPAGTAAAGTMFIRDVAVEPGLLERWARVQVSTLLSLAVHLALIVALGLMLIREEPKTVLSLVASSEEPAPELTPLNVDSMKLEVASLPAPEPTTPDLSTPVTIDLSPPSTPTLDILPDPTADLTASIGPNIPSGPASGFAGIAGLETLNERLGRASAKTGDIQISLMWGNRNDLDLHVQCPSGEIISFYHRHSRDKGMLDVDMNAGGHFTDEPVENVFWPLRAAPKGRYTVFVDYYHNYAGRDSDPTKYQVAVKYGDIVKVFDGHLSATDPTVIVCEFDYSPKR